MTEAPNPPGIELTEISGLLLAVGVVLTSPVSDANRLHFARRCLDEADRLTPGISDVARTLLPLGDA